MTENEIRAQEKETMRQEALKTLQEQFAGVRLSKGKMGTRKTLDPIQRAEAAAPFDAEAEFLGASKKLLDTKDPTFKAVTAILSRASEYYKANTLPYPEEGTRLLKREKLDEFQAHYRSLQIELEIAVGQLAGKMDDLKRSARASLGSLYNPDDYPDDLDGLFRVSIDFPNLTPPDYLRTANPALYEEQSARIAARFDSAVSLAEEAFSAELADMVDTLQRKLQGLDDGTEKRLKESTIENMVEFFARFKTLNLHSSAELDRIVEQAESILGGKDLLGSKGITRDDLRNSQSLRSDVRTKLSAVSAQLEGLMTVKPRRAITRRPKTEQIDQVAEQEPVATPAANMADLPPV